MTYRGEIVTGRIGAQLSRAKQKGRAALVTFVTAGDPDYETSLKIMDLPRLVQDDRVWACLHRSHGGWPRRPGGGPACLACRPDHKNLKLVREFRAGDKETPVVLMGYYNPIYVYGVRSVPQGMPGVAPGVDGLIVVDSRPRKSTLSSSYHRRYQFHPPGNAHHR